MGKEAVTIHSLSDFVKVISKMRINSEADLFHDPHLFYRGQSNKDYQLVPTLGRYVNVTDEWPLQFTFFEKDLIQRAKSEYPTLFTDNLLPFALLALLQHYGIPTRLLDITTNAFVALFFACSNLDRDGEVIVFHTDRLETGFQPEINAIADTCEIHAGENDMPFRQFWNIVQTKQYFYKQVSTIVDYSESSVLSQEDQEKQAREKFRPRFVIPQQLTQRQKNQGSLFVLFPNAAIDRMIPNSDSEYEDQPGIGDRIDPIDKDSNLIKLRVIIPCNIKEQLLAELKQFGIEEALLFPEDIDRGCNQIVREYRDRLLRTTGAGHDAIG